jgi:DNA polymerase I-like protein with 3'-5' exonuclease and polymerase domains
LFQQQKDELKENQQLKRLCWWGCQDILVTQEMEYNGIKFDLELSKKIGDDYLKVIDVLDNRLRNLFPYSFLNFGSHENLSALLYGGPVSYSIRETYEKTLKSGLVKTKEHWVEKIQVFPRLVEPLKGTSLKKKDENDKDLYFKTDEGTLKKLKAFGKAKQCIEIVLERAKIAKKVGTYFHGIPKLYEEMHWGDGTIHGQLIHCRAATGRLASNSPNQQNFDEEVRKCIITRFSRH